MPFIKYKLSLPDDELVEMDILPRTDNPRPIIQERIDKLNEFRIKRGEPTITLGEITVTNPFWHYHSWEKTHQVNWVGKVYYTCSHCNIVGYKRIGHEVGDIERENEFKSEKNHLCKDVLKELPRLK